MSLAIRGLDLLFGKGDDDYPFWLLTVRLNILLLIGCLALLLVWNLAPARRRRLLASPRDLGAIVVLTVVAAAMRMFLARPNLMDFGGIAYSRLLYGYKGYFATAQFFAPFYQLTARDIEHAIFFDQVAGTLTIPLVYLLCRYLRRGSTRMPLIAAFLFAVYPLHVLFSASDALAIFSTCLAACSYVLLVSAEDWEDPRRREAHYLGGFVGLTLLTQARYENVLLLIPAAVVLFARRRSLRVAELVRPLTVAALFLVIYGWSAFASGLSYQNPSDVEHGFKLVVWHVVLNPFFAIPLLLLATFAVVAYRPRFGALALLPWPVVFVLAVATSQDGHGAARVYANWLILILPVAAYGVSLMLESNWLLARVAAGVILLLFAAQPLALYDTLGAQHLEIRENDVFQTLLTNLPRQVNAVVVPDDELMSRQPHSTLEVYRKYALILAARPQLASRITLVGLTEYLEHPERTRCSAGTCAFFFGLPCTEEDVYPQTSEQCRQLLGTHHTSALSKTSVVGAPFVNCSIYPGFRHQLLCDPATRERQFVVYQIDSRA